MSTVLNIVEKTKVCTKCSDRKPLHAFGKHQLSFDGLRPSCKTCRHDEYKKGRVAAGKIIDERKTVELIEGGRVCRKCNVGKSWDKFIKDVHGYNNKTATCLDCRNEKFRQEYRDNPNVRRSGIKNRPDKLKRLYGVTYEQIVRVLDSQYGLCANRGCGKQISLSAPRGPERAVIDHCHVTGDFRAILCTRCNLTLGELEKNQNKFAGLLEYIARFNHDV